MGVQGCGKSLCAKVVASAWHMPLVRMDPGVLYQKFIGGKRARLREALRQAESMSPVVLWIDEIEKAFASASSDSADGGLSQRMFGTLLVVDARPSPSHFLDRHGQQPCPASSGTDAKGRFDEIFFVDLPGPDECAAIFAIHLRKRGRDKTQFDLTRLAEAAEGFTGAEIEQAVISGMYTAFAEKADFATEHTLAAMRATQPLSVVMREHVQKLRNWAQTRCVMAD